MLLSNGSDISVHGYSDKEISSDTDSEPEYIETQSSLGTLDRQLTDS